MKGLRRGLRHITAMDLASQLALIVLAVAAIGIWKVITALVHAH